MSDKSDRHLYHKYETLNMTKMGGGGAGGHSPPLSRATSPLNHDYDSGACIVTEIRKIVCPIFEFRMQFQIKMLGTYGTVCIKKPKLSTGIYLSCNFYVSFEVIFSHFLDGGTTETWIWIRYHGLCLCGVPIYYPIFFWLPRHHKSAFNFIGRI